MNNLVRFKLQYFVKQFNDGILNQEQIIQEIKNFRFYNLTQDVIKFIVQTILGPLDNPETFKDKLTVISQNFRVELR